MNQVQLATEARPETGKGAAGRLRKTGRVPGIVYGYEIDPTPVSLDALEVYHALHGPAGTNVLLLIEVEGTQRLCVARDIHRHPVRGDYLHIDLLSVDKNATIVVEVPIHLVGEADPEAVISQVLSTVPIHVPPLNTPNSFDLSIEGMVIGDVLRVDDLEDVLPEGARFDIEPERTIVTANPPEILEVEDDDEGDLLMEGEGGDEPDAEGEGDAEGDEGVPAAPGQPIEG